MVARVYCKECDDVQLFGSLTLLGQYVVDRVYQVVSLCYYVVARVYHGGARCYYVVAIMYQAVSKCYYVMFAIETTTPASCLQSEDRESQENVFQISRKHECFNGFTS